MKLDSNFFDKEDQPLPQIKEVLLDVVGDIIEDLKAEMDIDLPVSDIVFTGSLFSLQWDEMSDVDLHIIVEYDEYSDEEKELMKDFLRYYAKSFNNEGFDLKGRDLEVYFQDKDEPFDAPGIYSLKSDDWIKKPVPETIPITKDMEETAKDFKIRADDLEKEFEGINGNREVYKIFHDKVKSLYDEIKTMRRSGFAKEGLKSKENQIFKLLRRNGTLDKLVSLIRDAQDGYYEVYESGKSIELLDRINSDIERQKWYNYNEVICKENNQNKLQKKTFLKKRLSGLAGQSKKLKEGDIRNIFLRKKIQKSEQSRKKLEYLRNSGVPQYKNIQKFVDESNERFLEGEQLNGKLSNFFKIRFGDYRVVYRYDKECVYITVIYHRKEVYRKLEDFNIFQEQDYLEKFKRELKGRKDHVLLIRENDQWQMIVSYSNTGKKKTTLKVSEALKMSTIGAKQQANRLSKYGEEVMPVSIDNIHSYKIQGLEEAEYQGLEVELNKPMRGDVKKYKVYVKDPQTGNTKKVNFGDKNMEIKRDDPERRKSFRARHKCDTAKDKTTPRYWSCKFWDKEKVSDLLGEKEKKDSVKIKQGINPGVVSLIPETDALRDYILDDSKTLGGATLYDNNKVIGFFSIHPTTNETGISMYDASETYCIIEMIVSEKYRGKGYGGLLLKSGLKIAKNMGFKKFIGYTYHSDEFLALSKKHGIIDIDDASNEIGWANIANEGVQLTEYKRNIKRFREIQQWLYPSEFVNDLSSEILKTFPERKKARTYQGKDEYEGSYWDLSDEDKDIYNTHKGIEHKKRGYPTSGNSETMMRNRVYRHNVTFGQQQTDPHDGKYPSKMRKNREGTV